MRYCRIKMVNYIGIYNGQSGREILEIKFPKTGNSIVGIKGLNGTGKSTVFNALNMFPDSNNSFVPKVDACKELDVEHNGFLYKIQINHNVKNDGSRGTTKAYINKLTNNGPVDLNPNGNVSSYLEVLQTEFNLDPCAQALSKISCYDRGLADKKPGERKKFVNDILSELIHYNNLNKVFSKRASVFRSFVNSLSVKIDQIGSVDKLINQQHTIEQTIDGLLLEKEKLIELSAYNKSMIMNKDPNGSIQNTYQEIYQHIENIKSQRNPLKRDIDTLLNSLGLDDIDKAKERKDQCKELINQKNMELQLKENSNKTLLSTKEAYANDLSAKLAHLDVLKMDNLGENIKEELDNLYITKTEYESYLNNTHTNLLSSDEYKSILDNIQAMDNLISIFKDEYTEGEINTSMSTSIDYDKVDIDSMRRLEKELNAELNRQEGMRQLSDKLSLRPKDCKIDNCPFISSAIESGFRQDSFDNLVNDIRELEQNIIQAEEANRYKDIIISCKKSYDVLLRNLNGFDSTISKLITIINSNISFKDIISNNVSMGYLFNDKVNVLYNTAVANEAINDLNSKIFRLETEHKIFVMKNKEIDLLIQEIDSMNTRISTITQEIIENKEYIEDANISLAKLSGIALNLDKLLLLKEKYEMLCVEYNDEMKRYLDIKDAITDIKLYKDSIGEIETNMRYLEEQITPIMKERDSISHKIQLSKEYIIELEDYKSKFNKIQRLKYHSSSNTGIQLIFMDLYMNKMISLANQLLGLMFNGQYVLCNFEIDEDGFRIPVIGKGMKTDDITSCSTSEICMISLIISFSLLAQSSSAGNVLMCDEIDGGLDHENRRQFILLLQELINILNVEQCFIVTHNNEFPMNNMDLVVLSKSGTEDFSGANIIYDNF